MMRPSALPWLVLVVTFAGCAGGSAETLTSTGPAEPSAVIVTDTTGAIQGIVVDTQFQPLENATVTVLGADKEAAIVADTLTGGGGAFGFSLLEPGTYRVRATRDGFGNGSRLVTIESGATINVQITLDEAASTDPYLVTIIKSGYLSCAVATVVFPTNNRCPGDEPNGNSTIRFDIPEGFAYLVSESVWQAQGEDLSQYFYARYKNQTSGENESRSILDLWGGSVLRSSFRPGELKATVNPGTGALIINAPVPTTAFNLTVISYYAGLMSDEINQTAAPACRPIYSRCAGVGITLGLRYQQFLSIFIYGVPDDVESYSAVPDS